jgi:hypothetical protein
MFPVEGLAPLGTPEPPTSGLAGGSGWLRFFASDSDPAFHCCRPDPSLPVYSSTVPGLRAIGVPIPVGIAVTFLLLSMSMSTLLVTPVAVAPGGPPSHAPGHAHSE